MPAFTVQDLVDRAASYADMRDGFVQPSEWIAWFNTEARALDLFLLRHGYTQVRPSSSSPDANTWTFEPTDALAILGVYEVRDGKFRPLKYLPPAEFYMDDALVASTRPRGDANFFTIERVDDSVNITMSPMPSSGTYKMLYYADTDTVDALTDPVSYPFGFEERIILGMALRGLVKENSDTSQIEKLIGKEDERIEELCWTHSFADAGRIRNVDSKDRGWSGWYNYLPYGSWESWYWL